VRVPGAGSANAPYPGVSRPLRPSAPVPVLRTSLPFLPDQPAARHPELVGEHRDVLDERRRPAHQEHAARHDVRREVPRLERFQSFLRLAVAAGPLLGLIGTVIGMIITFQSITESGSSDPRLMANGIGQAMIATVLGLGIAVPLLFINAGLASMSRYVVQVLDEQSTGLLAERLERANGGSPQRA